MVENSRTLASRIMWTLLTKNATHESVKATPAATAAKNVNFEFNV